MKSLCNAYVIHLNERSKFNGFEIVTMRELECPKGGTQIEELKTHCEFLESEIFAVDEPFYRVHGIYRDKKGKRCFGDFNKIEDAVQFLEELTGLSVYIYSI
jgi:hypothetical protein